MNRAGGLALITAAIALWNAAHLPAAVAELRRRGEVIVPENLGHLSSPGWEHITLTGTYRRDLTPTFALENRRRARLRAPRRLPATMSDFRWRTAAARRDNARRDHS